MSPAIGEEGRAGELFGTPQTEGARA